MKKPPILLIIALFAMLSGCTGHPADGEPVYFPETGSHKQPGPHSGAQSTIDPVKEAAKLVSPFAAGEESAKLNTAEIEKEFLRLVNAEREAAGVKPLETKGSISWAAGIRAEEIVDDTSHYRPDGTPYYTVFDEAGYSYAGKLHGENIYYIRFEKGLYSEKEAARRIFSDLKKSSGNSGNMQSAGFAITGIGAFADEDLGYYKLGFVQLFSG